MSAIEGKVQFNIGNSEIANYLVEQQIQRLRNEQKQLDDKRMALVEENEAINNKYAAMAQDRFDAFKAKMIEVAQVANPKLVKQVEKWLALGSGTQYNNSYYSINVFIDTESESGRRVARWLIGLVDGDECRFTRIKFTRADAKKKADNYSEINRLFNESEVIRRKMQERDNIERTMLAQLTRNVLDNSPELTQQLANAVSGALGNRELLALPAK